MATGNSQDAADRQLGAFAHVDRTDSGEFISRLDEMQALESFRAYKRVTFDLLNLQAGSKAADIGCGTGDDAAILAGVAGPGGHVTGFDLSEAMVAESRARHSAVPGLEFTSASSDSLGLADRSLDGIRADRVLIHVPDPHATLDEMIRVTKPGGRIVISEPDMPGFWVASSDYATTALIVGAIARSCVTPYLPRDLWAMFNDRGLRDIDYVVRTITSFELAAAAKVLDFAAVLKLMVGKGALDEAGAAAWLDDLTQRGRGGRFVAGLSIMIASATKP